MARAAAAERGRDGVARDAGFDGQGRVRSPNPRETNAATGDFLHKSRVRRLQVGMAMPRAMCFGPLPEMLGGGPAFMRVARLAGEDPQLKTTMIGTTSRTRASAAPASQWRACLPLRSRAAPAAVRAPEPAAAASVPTRAGVRGHCFGARPGYEGHAPPELDRIQRHGARTSSARPFSRRTAPGAAGELARLRQHRVGSRRRRGPVRTLLRRRPGAGHRGLASDELRARFVSCDLERSGLRHAASIERPGCGCCGARSTPEELQTYQRVYDSARALGDDEPAAFTLVLQALLSSAEFLYRIELDPDPQSTSAHPLEPVRAGVAPVVLSVEQRARRRACSMPLRTSPAEAAGRALSRRRSHARRRSEVRALRRATLPASGWARARSCRIPSPRDLSSGSRQAAQRRQPGDAPLLLRLPAERAFVVRVPDCRRQLRGRLRSRYFYGMPADADGVGTFERVEYDGDKRAGFFGLAGFLALTSLDRRTSPSLRGRWIASNLLCREPPPPPPDVPKLDGQPGVDGALDASTFDRAWSSIARTRAAPAAMRCSIPTAWRSNSTTPSAISERPTTDGTPVDASATLPASDAAPRRHRSSTGLDGLAAAVAADPQLRQRASPRSCSPTAWAGR